MASETHWLWHVIELHGARIWAGGQEIPHPQANRRVCGVPPGRPLHRGRLGELIPDRLRTHQLALGFAHVQRFLDHLRLELGRVAAEHLQGDRLCLLWRQIWQRRGGGRAITAHRSGSSCLHTGRLSPVACTVGWVVETPAVLVCRLRTVCPPSTGRFCSVKHP